jgi:hypothetical protein
VGALVLGYWGGGKCSAGGRSVAWEELLEVEVLGRSCWEEELMGTRSRKTIDDGITRVYIIIADILVGYSRL